jgi:flagellar capping protein FliD
LINDYKSCEEYSSELETRLIDARDLIGRTVKERNEYKELYSQLDEALKTMTSRKMKLERKLKRTRTIGIVGTIGGLIVGVLLVLFI